MVSARSLESSRSFNTQCGVLPSWQCMAGLARVPRSGIPMGVHPVLAGGSGEGSPQLQHERIIPQWKAAEGSMGERVRPKALISRGRSGQLHSVRLEATYLTLLEALSSPLLLFLTHTILSVSFLEFQMGRSFIVWQTSRTLPIAVSWGNENPH